MSSINYASPWLTGEGAISHFAYTLYRKRNERNNSLSTQFLLAFYFNFQSQIQVFGAVVSPNTLKIYPCQLGHCCQRESSFNLRYNIERPWSTCSTEKRVQNSIDAQRTNFDDLRGACQQDKTLFPVLFVLDKNRIQEKLNSGAQPILSRIRLLDNVTDMIIFVETMKQK